MIYAASLGVTLFLYLTGGALAQSSSEKRINVNKYSYASTITPAYDGGHLVGGFYSTLTSTSSVPLVVNLDASGNVRWAKPLTGTFGSASINRLTRSADGEYYAAGVLFSSVAQNTFIVKFDQNGKTLWASQIPTHDPANAFGFTPTADGGCFISEQIGAGVDAFAVKYASDGSVTWQKKLRGSVSELVAACVLSDGSFIVAGYSNHVPSSILIVKFLASGGISWSENVVSEGGDRGFLETSAIVATRDGGFAISGLAKPASDHDAYVAKFDSAGKMIWSKDIELFGDEGAPAIAETAEGNIIIAGNQRVEDSFFNAVNNGFIVILSADGNITRSEIIALARTNLVIQSICTEADGSIHLAGNAADSAVPSNGGIFLAKFSEHDQLCNTRNTLVTSRPLGAASSQMQLPGDLDLAETAQIEFGEDMTASQTDLCTLAQVAFSSEAGQNLYPNPASTAMNFTGLIPGTYDLTIEDLTGRTLIYETVQILASEYQLDISALATGAYIAEIRSHASDVLRMRRKFVKE